MAKQPKPKPNEHPDDVGERWRSQMRASLETLPALIWKRVHAVYRLDLSDPKQASGVQIYRLLHELMRDQRGDEIDVEVIDLEACIDARVPGIFKLK